MKRFNDLGVCSMSIWFEAVLRRLFNLDNEAEIHPNIRPGDRNSAGTRIETLISPRDEYLSEMDCDV